MQCYSELIPPTAVTHAIALNFLSNTEKSLIVAKTSLLQIFQIRTLQDDQDGEISRLILVGEYELSGTITALDRVRTKDSKHGTDSLIVACRHAKLSLLVWDFDNHRISTTSIHYYEGEQVPRQPCDTGASHELSILTVDPSSRCVALKFDERQLAILPFRQPGEDLNELDGDLDLETEAKSGRRGEDTDIQTPYKKSFVLSLPSLDESLTDVVDLAFLHNYREPTFGILTSQGQLSTGLWQECKHALTYNILTLDLEQGASTILNSVPDMPATINKVIPLPMPIGGALLIGTNEIVHVAQNGKAHAVAVNEFAQLTAGINTSEQRALDLRLEDSVVQILDAGSRDVLLVLRNGAMAVLHFNMLGPDIKTLNLNIVNEDEGGFLLRGLPSCSAKLDQDLLFLGTDEADSLLVKYHKRPALSRKRSHSEMLDAEEGNDEDEDEMEEDDLYGTTTKRDAQSTLATKTITAADTYSFVQAHSLPSIGPINKICVGRNYDGREKLEMAASIGRSKGSALAILTRDLRPATISSLPLPEARSVWSVRAVKPQKKKKKQTDVFGADTLLFAFDGATTKAYSAPWQTASAELDQLDELTGTEFEHDGETVGIGTLGSGRWVVHCRRSEVRTYEPDLSLSQIIPLTDDETELELSIVQAFFSDPYLLLIRSDGSLQVLQYDAATQDVEPIEIDQALSKRKWLSGCIYQGQVTNDQPAAFMLEEDGNIQVFSLPELELVYTALNAAHLPPVLAADASMRRVGYKETLIELLVADIGPRYGTKPYLLLRASTDDLAVYEPFHTTIGAANWFEDLRFRKVPVPYLPKYDEYLEEDPKRKISSLKRLKLSTQSAVTIPGKPPALLLCDSGSRPKVLRIGSEDDVEVIAIDQSLAKNDQSQQQAALLSKNGTIHQVSLSEGVNINTGWAVQKLDIATSLDEVQHIAYHEQSGMYVISTSRPADFFFVEDDTRHPDQDDITSRPKVPEYSLHLYSATTHRIINTYKFPPAEAVTCVEVVPMDVSEHTHEVRSVVAVGTALLRGEDMPARGALVVFDILPVVPEPGDEETGIKLHVQSRAEVKGAVTTVAPFVGNLIGISQGQKIMVRGLKEDGTCLPVAFLDCLCQLVTLKTLWKSGLWLAGDALKGIWLGGFTEDPYKLTFLGKSETHMEVLCAEFMPFEGQLFVLAIDADMVLHVLQYDPEDPKTVAGARLLVRASFNIGHWPTSMTLVPSTFAPTDQQDMSNGHAEGDEQKARLYHILISTQSGSVTMITPLDSTTYRRLANLHGQLVSVLEQPAALNPREYRSAGGDSTALRGIVDGMIVQRIGELGSARRAEVLGRCGSDAWTMRSDLEIINGGGLGWL